MHIELKYSNKLSLTDKDNIINLLTKSFKNELISTSIKNTFFKGYESNIKNFILLYENKLIIGIAIIAYRKINILSKIFKTITVGPIAIDPGYQGKGLSKLLMKELDRIGEKAKTDFIYLGGINDFYQQFNYYSCFTKSKIIFECNNIKNFDNVKVIPLDLKHINRVNYLFNAMSKLNSLTSKREKEIWIFLIKFCKNSYHFYNPQIVFYNNKIVGYFCTDPIEKNRIRESIYLQKNIYIDKYLAGLKLYFDKINEKKIELMTPKNSLIYSYFKEKNNAIFVEYIKNNGGQLMKIQNIILFISKINNIVYKYNLILEYKKNKNVIKFTNLRKSDNKMIIHVFCEYKYFIGLITGNYNLNILQNFNKISTLFKEDLEKAFNKNIPFIYQGDNY